MSLAISYFSRCDCRKNLIVAFFIEEELRVVEASKVTVVVEPSTNIMTKNVMTTRVIGLCP